MGRRSSKRKGEKAIIDEEALWGAKELSHCRLVVSFDARERSVPGPHCQRGVLVELALSPLWTESGILKNQGGAIAERDFFGLPIPAYSFAKASEHKLVEALGLRLRLRPKRLLSPIPRRCSMSKGGGGARVRQTIP